MNQRLYDKDSGRLCQKGLTQVVAMWPTPRTTGMDGGSNSRKAAKARGMWPTPNTMDSLPPRENIREINNTRDGRKNRQALSNLREAVVDPKYQAMFPTPSATDGKGSGRTGKLRDRLDYAAERGATKSNEYGSPSPTGGQLNPTWVEWLMGFPSEWTALDASATP
jgi:DNA (cytosine-5)-methyltransferase 1